MSNAAITFYPYQQRWIKDIARFKIGMFARQTGKTFTTCAEIVDDVFEHEILGRKTRWVILSRGERQAKEAMHEGIKPFVRGYQAAAKGLADAVFYEDELRIDDTTFRTHEVEFSNGSRITALPANPDTARGFSANVFLDEFAFHQNSREIWKALFPVISAGWKLRVTSTPNGKSNKFYELMTADGEDGQQSPWSRHVVDIHNAVSDGLPRNIAELKSGLADADAWAQEYELQWMDEASAWLPYDLITANEHADAGQPEKYQGGICYVGVDIAARNDLFVIWVDEHIGDVAWTREIIAKKRICFAEQDDLLADVFDRYRVARCCMDQTGMGEKPVEDAKRRHGEHRVEGVIFSAASKLDMATRFKGGFQGRHARIPQGDTELRGDLHAVSKIVGPTGVPRLVAESGPAGHADRFWAGALASAAGASTHQEYAYQPVRPGDDSHDDDRPSLNGGFGKIRGAM